MAKLLLVLALCLGAVVAAVNSSPYGGFTSSYPYLSLTYFLSLSHFLCHTHTLSLGLFLSLLDRYKQTFSRFYHSHTR